MEHRLKKRKGTFFVTFIKLFIAALLLPLCLSAQSPERKSSHLSYGIPGDADTIVERQGYALGYIERHEQSAWVIYVISKEQVLAKNAERSNYSFRRDPAIPTGSASSSDYTRSGFDRGHLAPAADMAYSEQTMRDSFYMSNISPQRPGFNRGIWKDLESWTRQIVIKEQNTVIVTGPVFPPGKAETIGRSAVTVPTHFYKIIYDLTPPQKMIGFILPNEQSNKPLREFAVSVDKIEKLTGLNFFSEVPLPKQNKLESNYSVKAWYGL